jgi:polyphosphate kinase 2 (PPK2 family)
MSDSNVARASPANPQGCEVFSFKQPSAEELEHDFLGRTTCWLVSGPCVTQLMPQN